MTKTKRYQVRNRKTKTVRGTTVTRDDARFLKNTYTWKSPNQSYEIFDLANSKVIR